MIPLPFVMPKITPTRILIVALVAALVAQSVFLSLARSARDKAIAERATATQEAGRLVEAAKGSESTITQLQAANKALVAALASQQRAMDDAAAEVEPLKRLAEAQARALRERERNDRAKPNCQLVLNTVLDGACPALADGVRERANRRLPGSTG